MTENSINAVEQSKKPLIRCRNVSVKYNIEHHYSDGLKDTFMHGGKKLFKRLLGQKDSSRKNETKIFWALKNITLDVYPGDAVGLIGYNGSGKSTLLRHLAGTEFPDEGEVALRGVIGPLLSLTAGFKAHLSGMENIYLRGSLLGFKKEQLDKIIPQIKEFCDLGDFLYAPYRVYSSGMKGRLGFAISLFIDPDVLLLDEVIGVGDERFRKNAGNIFTKFTKSDNKAMVIATHSLELLRTYCNKVLWLHHGQMKEWGEANAVIDAYLNFCPKDKGSA